MKLEVPLSIGTAFLDIQLGGLPLSHKPSQLFQKDYVGSQTKRETEGRGVIVCLIRKIWTG